MHNKVHPLFFVHGYTCRWIWIFQYRRTAFYIYTWIHKDGRIFFKLLYRLVIANFE